ncbi:MAG TPA: endonuclease/exonuclease/phosphatase family protein [Caulobacteraceae bacterium]|nr:endonuclease/exonuclease/phosphatase family protein [Caulobacteraceae bacterium]
MTRHLQQIRFDRIWLILAGVCLAESLAAQGGRWSVALDLLADLAPLWLLGSVAAFAAALFLRGPTRFATLVAGLAGIAAAGALIAPELLRPPPRFPVAGSGLRLRVIQINFGGRGVRDPDRAAAWLAAQQPDVILVDDVVPPIRAAIERRGFHWRRGTAWTGIASREPLLPAPFPFSAKDWKEMPDLARARVATPDGPADILAVHLIRPFRGTGDKDPRVAVARLAGLADRYDKDRLIVGGDLNLAPWSFRLRRLDARLDLARSDRAAFTWPARLFDRDWPIPFMPLDHLYAGPAWKTVGAWVGPPIGATHRALVVDLVETSERNEPL